ncbi:MAG: 6-phosphofructokinase [Firmicutes bacterium]|nr:6-phosphofructokinase [Bacillota bacterium]
MKRVGLLTSGGDCQALNATMRGIAKALYQMYGDEMEIVGFLDGYRGLMYEDCVKLTPSDFSGILTKGGTFLGTSRTPFKLIREPDANGLDKVEAMKTTYRRQRLDCLYVLGGNGSQKTANLLSQEGLNVIGMPKTIDNDLWGTDTTFGFQSAIDIATNAIDCIHTTAASHNRCFIVEIMGHKAGWLTLNAGIAGGADIILIPEIPYQIEKVVAAVKHRNRRGRGFTIIAVAEGAMSVDDAKMGKKEYKQRVADMLKVYPSISYEIADQIKEATGLECRVTVPGHMQRGGQPNAYDRVLSTRLGTYGAILFQHGEFGVMAAIHDHKITSIPLSEVAGKLKTVPPDNDILEEARMLGICFGD